MLRTKTAATKSRVTKKQSTTNKIHNKPKQHKKRKVTPPHYTSNAYISTQTQNCAKRSFSTTNTQNNNNNNTAQPKRPKEKYSFGGYLKPVNVKAVASDSPIPVQSSVQRDFLTSKEFVRSWNDDIGGLATKIRRAANMKHPDHPEIPIEPLSIGECRDIETQIIEGKDPRPKVYVGGNNALQIVLDILQHDPYPLAVDLEFSNADHGYMPTLELMQIATRYGMSAVIDFKALDQHCKPLIELINTKHIILHGGGQDLQVLQNLSFQFDLPCKPAKCTDTQITSAVAGIGDSQISLANLSKQLLDVTIPKGLGASDWSMRPLDIRQVQYAFTDVRYLHQINYRLDALMEVAPPVYDVISNPNGPTKDVLTYNRVELAELLNEHNLAKERGSTGPDDSWKPIVRKLDLTDWDNRSIEVLKALCKWREIQGYRRNKSPNMILKHDVLVQLAKQKPTEEDIKKLFQQNTYLQANAAVLAQLIEAVDMDLVKTNVVQNPFSDDDNGEDKQNRLDEITEAQVTTLRVENTVRQGIQSMFDIVTHHVCSVNQLTPFALAAPSDLKDLTSAYQAFSNEIITKEQFDNQVQKLPIMNGFKYDILGKHLLRVLRGEEVRVQFIPGTKQMSIEFNDSSSKQ